MSRRAGRLGGNYRPELRLRPAGLADLVQEPSGRRRADRQEVDREYPIQFSLADFLCLFVQVQLVLAWPAMLFRTSDDRRTTPFVLVSALVVALVLLVWWTGVRTLSRAGVHRTLARALILTVTIPLGYASAIAVPVVAIAFLASLTGRDPLFPWIMLVSEFALIALVWSLGVMTRRLLAWAHQPTEPPPPEELSG